MGDVRGDALWGGKSIFNTIKIFGSQLNLGLTIENGQLFSYLKIQAFKT